MLGQVVEKQLDHTDIDFNAYGKLAVPLVRLPLEQLILILYPSLLIPACYLWFTYQRQQKKTIASPTGCRKVTTQGQTSLQDQYDRKYETGTDNQDDWRIKSLMVFPIKSCAPVEVDRIQIVGYGPLWDRIFVFAELLPSNKSQEQDHQWTFRTLRQSNFRKLALVRPEVWVPTDPAWLDNPSPKNRVEETGAIIVKYPFVPTGPLAALDRFMIRWGLIPGENSFQIPLVPPKDRTYPKETIKVWHDTPTWLNFGEYIPSDFQEYIGTKNRLTLFRVDPDGLREVYRCAPRKEEVGFQPTIASSDTYPIHLMNLASVRDVGNRVKETIPKLSYLRFRPNVLITGPKAFDEDDWKRILVWPTAGKFEGENRDDAVEIFCSCHSVRCKLPNVDPETGEQHPNEPDRTLRNFRCIDEGAPKTACLGMQCVPAKNEGVVIRVGDRVQLMERGEHHYKKHGS